MAGNINSPIVLDFFGLPGCGKSTVSHLLANKLREKGYRVYEPSYELDHRLSHGRRKIEKIRQYAFYAVLHPVKVRKITELVKDNGYKVFLEHLSQCINIATKLIAVKKRNYDYIIFDEGFNQAAISLSLYDVNTENALRNYRAILDLCQEHIDIRAIYLELDVETALQRLKRRGENNSRVDGESDESKRNSLIWRFNTLCESINEETFLTVSATSLTSLEDRIMSEICKIA